jgi:hypothetical protein
MNWLTGCTSNCAYWKAFGGLLRRAIITCGNALLDHLDLSIESSCTALNERDVCGEAHFVDMSARFQVIQGIEYKCEFSEPIHVELRLLDVRMIWDDFRVGIKLGCRLLCYLNQTQSVQFLQPAT